MNDYGLRDIFKQDFEQLHLKFFSAGKNDWGESTLKQFYDSFMLKLYEFHQLTVHFALIWQSAILHVYAWSLNSKTLIWFLSL